MPIQFKACDGETDIEKLIFYALDHRRDIHPGFGVKYMLRTINAQLRHGRIYVATDPQGEWVGVFGFINGTPSQRFMNNDTVRVEMAYLRDDYRGTRAFVRGLQYLIGEIGRLCGDINEFQFYVSAEHRHLIPMFAKFADLSLTHSTDYGEEHLFTAPFGRVADYARRFLPGRRSQA